MPIPIRRALVVLIVALSGGCVHAPVRPAMQRHEYVQLLMGVRVRLVAYAPSEAVARDACKTAFERVAELENIMSDYLPDSELMRLSARAGTGPQPVGPELLEILDYAQEVSRRSDGAFDITVGPYVRLWRAARKTKALPAGSALADARLRVGWNLLKLDRTHQTVDLTVPGMQLDLGGIAKGYAGDQAIRVLRDHGITSALFEAGGDIVVSDPPPGKKGWEIEIDDSGKKVTLHNAAISTSGDTAQHVDIAGVRYSHVVDPRTGMALTEHFAATVIARRGITSDSVSTAATVLGPGARGGDALIRSFGARGFVRKVAPQTPSTSRSTTSVTNP